MRVTKYLFLWLSDYSKRFCINYRLITELDAAWMIRILRWRATALVAILWMLVSMATVCCIQILQVSMT